MKDLIFTIIWFIIFSSLVYVTNDSKTLGYQILFWISLFFSIIYLSRLFKLFKYIIISISLKRNDPDAYNTALKEMREHGLLNDNKSENIAKESKFKNSKPKMPDQNLSYTIAYKVLPSICESDGLVEYIIGEFITGKNPVPELVFGPISKKYSLSDSYNRNYSFGYINLEGVDYIFIKHPYTTKTSLPIFSTIKNDVNERVVFILAYSELKESKVVLYKLYPDGRRLNLETSLTNQKLDINEFLNTVQKLKKPI